MDVFFFLLLPTNSNLDKYNPDTMKHYWNKLYNFFFLGIVCVTSAHNAEITSLLLLTTKTCNLKEKRSESSLYSFLYRLLKWTHNK